MVYIPTCHYCNSVYKGDIDTLYEKQGSIERQVKAFLPFEESGKQHDVLVKVTLAKHYDKDNFRDCGMQMSFSCNGKEEEIHNWLRIYKIEERYTSFCYSAQMQGMISDLLSMLNNPEYVDMQIKNMENLSCLGSYFLQAIYVKAVVNSLRKSI